MRGGNGGGRAARPGVFLLVVASIACAAGVASTTPPRSPGAADNDEATVPPPRGAPPPRLADTPPPEHVEEEVERSEERFLLLHNRADEQRRQQPDQRPVPAVEAYPLGTGGGDAEPDSCGGLEAPERTTCPLRAAGRVQSITDLPDGVRLTYQKNQKVSAERLYQMVACQQALALASPRATPLCPFVERGTEVAVSEQQGRTVVDLRIPDRAAGVDLLRERVRTAFRARP